MSKISIPYATRSQFKIQEIDVIVRTSHFRSEDGSEKLIGDRFVFEFPKIRTDEPLEVDLEKMVKYKAISAYKILLMPCIVEHAGLILAEHKNAGFPGGLTQPMMDALGAEAFVRRLSASGERAIARTVIGYCDGLSVKTFIGETEGVIVGKPKGDREFYWDTVFAPDGYGGDTYAEISDDPTRGLAEKMKVSQSVRALRIFLEFRVRQGLQNSLFTHHYG